MLDNKEEDGGDNDGGDGENAEYESPPGSALGQSDDVAELSFVCFCGVVL